MPTRPDVPLSKVVTYIEEAPSGMNVGQVEGCWSYSTTH